MYLMLIRIPLSFTEDKRQREMTRKRERAQTKEKAKTDGDRKIMQVGQYMPRRAIKYCFIFFFNLQMTSIHHFTVKSNHLIPIPTTLCVTANTALSLTRYVISESLILYSTFGACVHRY